MDPYRLAGRIRAFRKLKGYTQNGLAKKLGISVSVLGAVERGTRKPEPALLGRISEALGIGRDELEG